MPRARAGVFVLALAAAVALWLAQSSGGAPTVSPQEIIALLNAQRAQNGIPAGIVENPRWSADCARHNHYEALNDVFGHTEVATAAGYSTGGSLAAMNSVIDSGAAWGPGDPYDDAPFHLFQLLAPSLAVAGAADSAGRDCVTTLLGDTRPEPRQPVAYSYPGNGRSGIAASETADEIPTTPALELGLGTRATGPNLFVYFSGPWAPGAAAHVTSATVAQPGGAAVPSRVLDNTTGGVLPGSYPTGAIIVPVSPLHGATVYEVDVAATINGISPGANPGGQCEKLGSGPRICGAARTWQVSDTFTFTTGA
jgi:hypothetical protein